MCHAGEWIVLSHDIELLATKEEVAEVNNRLDAHDSEIDTIKEDLQLLNDKTEELEEKFKDYATKAELEYLREHTVSYDDLEAMNLVTNNDLTIILSDYVKDSELAAKVNKALETADFVHKVDLEAVKNDLQAQLDDHEATLNKVPEIYATKEEVYRLLVMIEENRKNIAINAENIEINRTNIAELRLLVGDGLDEFWEGKSSNLCEAVMYLHNEIVNMPAYQFTTEEVNFLKELCMRLAIKNM